MKEKDRWKGGGKKVGKEEEMEDGMKERQKKGRKNRNRRQEGSKEGVGRPDSSLGCFLSTDRTFDTCAVGEPDTHL